MRGNLGSDSSYIENVNFDVRTRVVGVHFVIGRGRTLYIYGVCYIVLGRAIYIVRICLEHIYSPQHILLYVYMCIQYKYIILLYEHASYYYTG